MLRVLLELRELRDWEVADCVPYGGPLLSDSLDDVLLEVLRRATLEEELRSDVSQVTLAESDM